MSKIYLIGAIALILTIAMVKTLTHRAAYRQGYADALNAKQIQQIQTAQRIANHAAQTYAASQAAQIHERKSQYEILQKIIAASDVYHRDCLDADGLRELNARIKK
nr:MAG TPA: hypothetical protein [Bacteriophage sp.]